MKIFKTIDIFIQLLLLFIMAINALSSRGKDIALLYSIVFGAWQVLSSVIQLFTKFKKSGWRIAYSVAGVVILFSMLAIKLDLLSEDNFITVLTFLAPSMGIYYLSLSTIETVQLYRKTTTTEKLQH